MRSLLEINISICGASRLVRILSSVCHITELQKKLISMGALDVKEFKCNVEDGVKYNGIVGEWVGSMHKL